jgi:hypothetical protein
LLGNNKFLHDNVDWPHLFPSRRVEEVVLDLNS